MSKIDREKIDEVLESVKIEEVINDCLGSYDPLQNRAGLKKRGVRYEALCPFHDDKSMGSFMVYPKGNCYKCFSCGAKGGAIDFLMEHEKLSYPDAIRWLGKKYNIDVDGVDPNWTYTPRPAPPPLDMLELPWYLIHSTEWRINDDPLVNWLRTGINLDSVQRGRLWHVLKDYHVAHAKYGHTIFWQIDEKQRIRTGKMMKYRADGHRDKVSEWNFDFIHSVLSRKRKEEDPWPYPQLYNPDRQEPHLTFYGMHLLDEFGADAEVCIVESEKTALIMATVYGNIGKVWMACGGIEMITRERLQPIIDRHRRIVLFPDRDGIDKWRKKAEQIGYDRMTLNTEAVTKWWKPEDGEKADIADVVVRMLRDTKELTDMNDVKAEMPEANKLIEHFNLEITEDENRRA